MEKFKQPQQPEQSQEKTEAVEQEIIEDRKIRLELIQNAVDDCRDKLSYLGGSTIADIVPDDLRDKIRQYDARTEDLLKGLSRDVLNDEEWRDYILALDQLNDFYESAVQNRADEEKMVWIGNWREGDRPEGYQRLTKRYQELEKTGEETKKIEPLKFFLQRRLGLRWQINHNALMEKAKYGLLTQGELDDLLADNQTSAGLLDEFEAQMMER